MRTICLMVLSGMLTLFTPSSLPSQTPRISVEPSRISGVSLLSPGSADFDREVAERINTTLLGNAQFVLPYSVIVVNNTTKTIRAHAARFLLTDRAGRKRPYTVTASNVLERSEETGLGPGRSHFSSLVPELNMVMSSRGRALAPSLNLRVAEFLSLLAGQQEIVVSLDSVLFADGLFVGPDESHSYELIDGRLRAQADLMGEILSLSPRGAEDVRQRLRLIAASRYTPGLAGEYGRTKMRLAGMMVQVLNTSGMEQLLGQVEETRRRAMPNIRRGQN